MRITKEESEKSRLVIIKNALKLFSEQGVTPTSMIEIAQKSNMSRGAIYWHFKDKWDLFDAIWAHYSTSIKQCSQTGNQSENTDALLQLTTFIKFLFTSVATQKDFQRIIKMCWIENNVCGKKPLSKRMSELMEEIHQEWVTYLDNAVHQQQLPNVLDTQIGADFIEASVNGILQKFLQNPHKYNLIGKTDALVEAIILSLEYGLKKT